MSLRVVFRLVELTAPTNSYTNILEVGNTLTAAPKDQFTVYMNNGRSVCDFNSGDLTVLDADPVIGWHTLEARVCYAGPKFTAALRYLDRRVDGRGCGAGEDCFVVEEHGRRAVFVSGGEAVPDQRSARHAGGVQCVFVHDSRC